MSGIVASVAADEKHRFSKTPCASIHLLAGEGVRGDAHAGATVKHRSRVAVDPSQPNLRQVHLIHAELFVELGQAGFHLAPGDLGENILTEGVDLLGLPRGTALTFPSGAAIVVTGLRNPCAQIDAFRPGLLAAVLSRSEDGRLLRKCGIMGIVAQSGRVAPGDMFSISPPDGPHVALDRV